MAGACHANTRCCISGTTNGAPVYMVSDMARQSLLYPIEFTEMEMDRNYYTDRRDFAAFELRYTYKGEGLLRYREKSYHVKAGDCFLINNREHHYYASAAEQWFSTVLHFDGHMAPYMYETFMRDNGPVFQAEECPNLLLYQHDIAHAMQNFVPYREFKISCLLEMMLTQILMRSQTASEENMRMPKIIRSTAEYMETEYARNITIEEISHMQNVSRSHLTREFKRYTGLSPKEYLNRIRLAKAKDLLLYTERPVAEIAADTGYTSESYFIAQFKKQEGVTPLKFRKR